MQEDELLEIENTTQNIKKFFGLPLRKTTPSSNGMSSGQNTKQEFGKIGQHTLRKVSAVFDKTNWAHYDEVTI